MTYRRSRGVAQTVSLSCGQVITVRSGFEAKLARALDQAGVPVRYEKTKLKNAVPARPATYMPDFQLPSGVYVEAKGEVTAADRKKHLLVRDQHPTEEIRFVFQTPNRYMSASKSGTYASWCDDNGFQYAKGEIPKAWLKENA